MNTYSIAHEVGRWMAQLQAAAAQAVTLMVQQQIGESYAQLGRAVQLAENVIVVALRTTATGITVPTQVLVPEGDDRYVVQVRQRQPSGCWACTCTEQDRVYAGVCAHIMAAKLAAHEHLYRQITEQRTARRDALQALHARVDEAERACTVAAAAYDAAVAVSQAVLAERRQLEQQIWVDQHELEQEQLLSAAWERQRGTLDA